MHPLGNGAYLGFKASGEKFALSLIKLNAKHEVELDPVQEFEGRGKFIPLNEHEALLHIASYKEEYSHNALYRISWK
ncbi:MAG: hypothetical protein Q4P08_01415 [Eubacteriales bacterium]|nr:hypothetical protein [Eubacteriales bacterium]